MTIAGYQTLIDLISDGDRVDADTINHVLSQLGANTDYLKLLFETALLGSAQFAFGQTVETDALVGQPVYYNSNNARFERALASAYTDETTGLLTTAPSSHVWGLVYTKHSATTADILISGYATIDLSNAVTGTVAAGVYYLGAATPGKLQATAPPVGIPVLRSDGDGNVHIFPSFTDVFAQHRHYRFPLVAYPAGDHEPPDPITDPHVITNADDEVEGWLPADDPSFEGNAPTGAKFGYNIAASSLAAVWPPMPIDSAYIEWNKGLDIDVGGTGTQQGTTAPLVQIDANGIWWMSDNYGDVPWYKDLDTASPPADPVPGENPREIAMSLMLWFTKMQFLTEGNAVTSLQAGSDKVTLTCLHSGAAATTGDLVVDVDLDATVDDGDDEAGDLVFKRFDTTTQTWFRGPIVESLRAGTNVTLTSDNEDDPDYYGTVTINASLMTVGTEFPIEEVRLDGVEEENYEGTLGLSFPAGRDTEFRAKVNIPGVIPGYSGATIKLQFTLLARAAGDLPALTCGYKLISRTATPAALPVAADTAVTVDVSGGVGIGTDEYVDVESEAFAVDAGDQVLFSLQRSSLDTFAGAVHVIDMRAVLASFVV